jgi:hypothetical protein
MPHGTGGNPCVVEAVLLSFWMVCWMVLQTDDVASNGESEFN